MHTHDEQRAPRWTDHQHILAASRPSGARAAGPRQSFWDCVRASRAQPIAHARDGKRSHSARPAASIIDLLRGDIDIGGRPGAVPP